MSQALALLAGCHPARLAGALGAPISEALAARLQAAGRVQPRLLAALGRRLGGEPVLSPACQRFLAMAAEDRALLARRAGAVWQAEAIAAILDGPAVRALVAAIGPELREFALRRRAWAGPGRSLDAAQVEPVGQACLRAWCEAQPAPAGRWLALWVSDYRQSDGAASPTPALSPRETELEGEIERAMAVLVERLLGEAS